MSPAEIRDFVLRRLSERLRIPLAEIDPSRSANELGIDSLNAVEVTGELEELLQVRVEATLFSDHASLDAAIAHVTARAPR